MAAWVANHESLNKTGGFREVGLQQRPVAGVRNVVLAYPGVKGVHALHVWSLGTGHDAVTVHVTADGADPCLGTNLGDVLRTRFDAEYVTVQVDIAGKDGSIAPRSCAGRE